MVATSSPHAVAAALWALAEGGTAADAAVAADAVLGVVQPHSTGVGGDAFFLVAAGDEVVGYNGSGPAPARLSAAACRAPGAWHDASALTVTVPGAVDAWDALCGRYGRLGLGRVLQPAIALASGGFPVGPRAASVWSANAGRLRPGAPWPAVVRPGERVANPALAETLAAVALGGREAHYTGAFAAAAVGAVQAAGGVLDLADLAAFSGEWVEPIAGGFRGWDVIQLPPNGQGAAVLAALARLEREPAGRPGDPDTVARTLLAIREGMQAAYRHVADPKHAEVPEFWRDTGRDTTYVAVVADGMAVSLISSVFMAFGSGLHAGGAALQNRGLCFRLDDGHPNVVAPGKRPFHTIIPAMARRAGERGVGLVFGCVGGPMQPQGQVQVLAQLLDGGADAQAAVDAPRVQWFHGADCVIEEGFVPGVREALQAAGFAPRPGFADPEDMGVAQVIRCHPDGWLEGGSDRRHDGLAAGW